MTYEQSDQNPTSDDISSGRTFKESCQPGPYKQMKLNIHLTETPGRDIVPPCESSQQDSTVQTDVFKTFNSHHNRMLNLAFRVSSSINDCAILKID